MTLGISTVAIKGTTQQLNNFGQLKLKQGDVVKGTIIDFSDMSLSIAINKGVDKKVIDLQINKNLNLNINDQIEIEVLKLNKDVVQLSIRKIEKEKIETAKSHDPLSDSVNLDKIKKSIVTTNNPLQFSKQLDNHIEHAMTQVDIMLESFSDEETSVILRENFDVTKMTIDLLYQVGHSNRVDKKLALIGDEERSVDISVNEEKINALIEEVNKKNVLGKTNKEDLQVIVKGLINNDIKPEPKNVEKLINFAEKVDKVKNMSSKEIIQFLSSNKESSIAELHKSLYISQKNVKKDMISEKDYIAIEADVKKIVKLNFENSTNKSIKEITEIAKALVKKGIPIDERAIETIKYIKEPANLEETIKIAIDQLKKQEKLDKVIVTSKSDSTVILKKEEVLELTKLVNKVTNDDVKAVILKNRIVSFHELELQIEEIEGNQINGAISKKNMTFPEQYDVNQSIDKNVENLQIIRYQMTYKAAMSLSIQGVDLKHSSLDIIREKIESFELLHIESSKSILNKTQIEGVKPSNVKIDLEETQALSKKELAVLEVKKHMAIISGNSTRSIATIAIDLSQSGHTNEEEVTLASLVKATSTGADRYDELRTMPRKDLGDNIEKAFANVKDILADLKLENSKFNQRAVKILGRNEMPITVKNIESVKVLDIELQELFTKLMPEHIKELVDQNVNVINEPIVNLVDYVRKQEGAIQKDMEEQVAKHIMTMLKNKEINSEQKEALVGVYRMIHTIESSKGAAVGFLLNNNMEVNIENLFDVAKVIRKSNNSNHAMDIQINDSFGKLETINREAMTIKEQIQSGYHEKEMNLNEFVSKVLSGSINKSSVTEIKANPQISQVISEMINNDVEKNSKVVNALVEKEEALELKELLTVVQKMQKGQLRENMKQNGKPSLNDLKAFDELSKNPAIIKDVFKEFVELNIDFEPLRGKLVSKITEFIDNLTPKGQEDFQKGMKELLQEAKDFALKDFFDKQSLENGTIFNSTKSVHQLSKEVESQLLLQKQLIDNEDYYSVPVMINGEIQHMSMYYFRQDSEDLSRNDTMSVYFSFTTENLGTANIRVQLKGEESNVTMYATNDIGNRQLKNYESDFKNLFNDVGLSVNKMKYDIFLLPTPVKPDQKIATANKVSKYNNNLFEKIV